MAPCINVQVRLEVYVEYRHNINKQSFHRLICKEQERFREGKRLVEWIVDIMVNSKMKCGQRETRSYNKDGE
jgi:hypothetical protein